MLQTSYFSGPLPEAEDLYKYSEPHQERILRLAEAGTVDESARRDRVVDAQIKQSNRAQFITPAMLVAFGGAAFYFFSNGQLVAGSLFLAMPVLRFLGTFVSAFAIRRNKGEGQEESK